MTKNEAAKQAVRAEMAKQDKRKTSKTNQLREERAATRREQQAGGRPKAGGIGVGYSWDAASIDNTWHIVTVSKAHRKGVDCTECGLTIEAGAAARRQGKGVRQAVYKHIDCPTAKPKSKTALKNEKRAARALGNCTVCGDPLHKWSRPGTTVHGKCLPGAAEKKQRRRLDVPCEYCTEILNVGDHSRCVERLKTVREYVGDTKRTRMPDTVKLSVRAGQRIERRKAKRPVKSCPACLAEHQKKGPFCSTVHSSAMRRWLQAGDAKLNKDGTYEVDDKVRGRLQSGVGAVIKFTNRAHAPKAKKGGRK